MVFALASMLLVGCESAPPTTQRHPQTGPAETPAPEVGPLPPVTRPTEALPPASRPAGEPELPDYVAITARIHPDQRTSAQVRTESGNRLVIDTRNVRRLRINRDRVPLNRRRSISLQLDGQGLEWLASSKVVEFECTVNGEWVPVKPESRK
jgi:hypothetical protein